MDKRGIHNYETYPFTHKKSLLTERVEKTYFLVGI